MTETSERRRNRALWVGLLLAVLGPLSNGLAFLGFPAATVPWISLALPLVGLGVVVVGLWGAFRRSSVYRGKIAGSIVAILSLVFWPRPSPFSGVHDKFRDRRALRR